MPYPDSVPQMLLHGLRFVGRVLTHYTGSVGSNVLGYFVAPVIVLVLGYVFTHRHDFKHLSTLPAKAMETIKQRWRPSLAIVYGLIFTWAAISEIWKDHYSLVKLQVENKTLSTSLYKKRHSIDVTDPVFPNIIYLLQAFDGYRHMRKGAPCVLHVTAPEPISDSAALASAFAQFSNSVSDCYTFGPDMLFDLNPDLKKEARTGMVPDAIVFHAARDDKAALQLFDSLSNQIRVVRSYELPAKPVYKIRQDLELPITIWLQFGTNVRWNSELTAGRN